MVLEIALEGKTKIPALEQDDIHDPLDSHLCQSKLEENKEKKKKKKKMFDRSASGQ